MMKLSYRTRQTLRRSLSIAATVMAVTAVVLVCLFVWLQRFVVYTDEGVILNFDRKNPGQSQLPQQPQDLPTVSIRYDDTPFQEGLQQLSGYYIPEKDLMADPLAVLEKLKALPEGTAVLLDVKGYRGYYFYSTAAGDHTSGLYNMEKMDELIRWLGQSDLYVIARMPALRDFVTVWDNSGLGLKTASGNLYADQGQYGLGYWLDPTNNTVQNNLVDILNELKAKGFDEVVLQNFCFPETDDLAFSGDKAQALEQLAQKLMASCANESFTLSFASEDPAFPLPEGRCRLFLENISAENAQSVWDAATVDDKRRNLVFIAPNGDTRYDIENGLLRPLA